MISVEPQCWNEGHRKVSEYFKQVLMCPKLSFLFLLSLLSPAIPQSLRCSGAISYHGGRGRLVSPQQVNTLHLQPCNLSPPLCAKGQSCRRQARQWTTNPLQPLDIQYPPNDRIYKNKYHPGNEYVTQSQNLPSTLDYKKSNKNQKEIIQSKRAA